MTDQHYHLFLQDNFLTPQEEASFLNSVGERLSSTNFATGGQPLVQIQSAHSSVICPPTMAPPSYDEYVTKSYHMCLQWSNKLDILFYLFKAGKH